ncbi:hypothetical protein D9M72_433400 [compost metagenome]
MARRGGGRHLPRQGPDARHGRRPLPPDGRRDVGRGLRRLLRPPRSRWQALARAAHAGGSHRAPCRCRRQAAGRRHAAAGVGFRSHLLRHGAAVGARAGSGIGDAAGGGDACQRAPDECQFGDAGAGRHRRRHRHRWRAQGRGRQAHRRAAGVCGDVPGAARDRPRPVAGCGGGRGGGAPLRARGAAGWRDHGDGSCQRPLGQRPGNAACGDVG